MSPDSTNGALVDESNMSGLLPWPRIFLLAATEKLVAATTQ
jgi:hypothetical protein